MEVSLEAFSPFIPLERGGLVAAGDGALVPGEEHRQSPLEVSLAGWLENAVCRAGDGGLNLRRRNAIDSEPKDRATLSQHGRAVPEESPARPDIVFADFEGTDYGGWTAEGKAFDDRPYREDERRFYTALSGYEGKGFVNTHMMRHGEDPAAADEYKGTLTSPEFTIERKFIHFRIGGGADPSKLGLRLLVDGKASAAPRAAGAGPMRREPSTCANSRARRRGSRSSTMPRGLGPHHRRPDRLLGPADPRVAAGVPGIRLDGAEPAGRRPATDCVMSAT